MRDEFVQACSNSPAEGGWSAVISSHDLEEIERLVDWVGYLRDGQLAPSLNRSPACRHASVRLM